MLKKEHRALRRRPLLTPLWLTAFVGLIAVAAVAWFWSSLATTTVILVRHAEKELGTIEDPPLSPAGEQRAAALARLLGTRDGVSPVAAVIASDTRRAQRTAAPLAERLGLTVTVLPGSDLGGLVRTVRSEYRGRTVVIVGHSNTVPELARRFSGRDSIPEMPDDQYGTIYVVSMPTLGPASVLTIQY